MHFELSDELKALVQVAREFAADKIAPFVEQWDKDHYFPYEEVVKPMAALGFLGTVIPEEYGGNDMGWLATMLVTEEIARACSSLRVQINMETVGCAFPILRYGSEELKRKYVPKLVSAEYLGGFAITEPTAGSDVAGMKSRAEDQGDHWLLNGSKAWISNASLADVIIYYAHTDRGGRGRSLSAFVVELKNVEGVSTADWHKMGTHLSPTGEIILENVRVPKENILAGRGQGHLLGQARLGPARLAHCMRWIGQAEVALDMMVDRALNRYAHGSSLAEKQGIQWMIADSTMELYQCKLMVLHAAYRIDRGEDFRSEVSMAKHFVANALNRIVDRAIQVHGALGYSLDTPLARMAQHARWARFADGADEVHQWRIAQRTIEAYRRDKSTRMATGNLPL